ncbi:hypothetical protein C1I60_05355 [Paenibacillus terrae]|uniref:Uncharacterized protein n=1 Tax=Paenibacillus terrae TaxID=159743 RepID=A0A4U2Q117_9BACL|nr:hypothetical protein C1I60_05355 [Paenibacillus terrae]
MSCTVIQPPAHSLFPVAGGFLFYGNHRRDALQLFRGTVHSQLKQHGYLYLLAVESIENYIHIMWFNWFIYP